MRTLTKHAALWLLFAFVLLAAAPPLRAERIFVSNDEWMFGNCCIATNNGSGTNDDSQFATNISSWLTGGAGGNILILSNNFGLTQSGLSTLLTTDGYTVTVTASAPVSLSGYNAVFVGGMPVDNTLLTNYVNGGGNVFLEGGTDGSAAGEAAWWNTFLNNFGLAFNGTSYNGVCCAVNVSAFQTQGPYGPALFSGVNTVYMNNGNNVLSTGADPNVQIFSDTNGNGLYGAWTSSVPEPSALLAMGVLLLGLGVRARRRQGMQAS